jgi:hypothetical protein
VFPWRVLPLGHALSPNRNPPPPFVSGHDRYEIVRVALANADGQFDIEQFGGVVVFMDPPPADAAALSVGYDETVLDWGVPQCPGGEQSHMAHEVGHVLGFFHAGGPDGTDYQDPYCVMSVATTPFSFAQNVFIDPDLPGNFYSSAGPLASASNVYVTLGEHASVVHVAADAPDTHQAITLRALSVAKLGDPVLAVIEVEGEKWTAEYRVPSGWDRQLDDHALVFHTIRYQPAPGQSALSRYAGAIKMSDDRGIRYWQAPDVANSSHPQTALAAVVQRADQDTVSFRFYRTLNHSVTLDYNLVVLNQFWGPRLSKEFPVYHGLCGEQVFSYEYGTQHQRLEATAVPLGYVNPVFAWKVNGVAISPGQTVTVQTTRYTDDGITVSAQPNVQATITAAANGEGGSALPKNVLWLLNDPADGTYDVSVTADVSEIGPRPLATSSAEVHDQFKGSLISIEGKDEADRKCAAYLTRQLVGQLQNLPPIEIHLGDPIYTVLNERFTGSPQERDEMLGLIALVRAVRPSDPERAHQIAQALSRDLHIPETLIIG